jgi:hypothetical protein
MHNAKRIAVLSTILAAGLGFSGVPAANAAARNYEAGVCINSGGSHAPATVSGYNQNGKYLTTPVFHLGKHCGYKLRWWFKPNQYIKVGVRLNGRSVWSYNYAYLGHCKTGSSNHSVRYCWIW